MNEPSNMNWVESRQEPTWAWVWSGLNSKQWHKKLQRVSKEGEKEKSLEKKKIIEKEELQQGNIIGEPSN